VTCAPADGRCRAEPVADGTPCPGGTCGAGACVPRPDAGVPDAGAPDAGTPDAGTPDAGAAADAAPPAADARPLPDAAPVPDGDDGGCGCSTGDPSAGLVLSVVVGWLARRRRRSAAI
jgi:MYXO-CTERM domain-containing protein